MNTRIEEDSSMDKFNVLIVDDEIVTRNGLKDYIPWSDYGVNIIGTAQNGNEALNIIKHEAVDILITDICMPIMDGLELAELIALQQPRIKIIIITAHGDFEYAKRAIKFRNVTDFILKPIDIDELIDAVKSNIAEIKIGSSVPKSKESIPGEINEMLSNRYLFAMECIESAIRELNVANTLCSWTDISNQMRSAKTSVDQLRMIVKLIFAKIENAMTEMNFGIKSIFFSDDQLYVINHLSDYESIEQHIGNLLISIVEYISNYRKDNLSSLIISAIHLTEKYFKDPDFSLTELARQLKVSTNYLSTKFKVETGINFVRFLNNMRISKAMELLHRREYRIYEIASLVGISDVGYFTKVFREYCGETPNGYRNRFIEKQWH